MNRQEFSEWLGGRVAALDGAMGTMIQQHALTAVDFAGDIAACQPAKVAGNNDLLAITRPDVITGIHRAYVEAGADIISTNTFNANAISQADYSTGSLVGRINRHAARLARAVADGVTDRRLLVAGSIGPTNRTASMSPDVSSPAARNVDFDALVDAYREQIDALVEGGVDILLMETVFDTLNLKAALVAAADFDIAVMVSLTVSSVGGRTLGGQTIEAFVTTVEPFDNVVSIGLNCSFGPDAIAPFVRQLAACSSRPVSVHPNAGLPDESGRYNATPESFVAALAPLMAEGIVNIVGGCCGTTPTHIAALAAEAKRHSGRFPSPRPESFRLAGLEELNVAPGYSFINIGERCNVAGSRKFLRLISEGNYAEAADIARRQVEDGAMIVDVNMDDAMLDSPAVMEHFLRYISADVDIAKRPIMIDSSRVDVIERALKQIPGRPVVNSISLKEGEAKFIEAALMIRRMGAAVVVMAFDEKGQADTLERKIEIAERAYRLLTTQAHFAPGDIIFDPGIMAIATGLDEHDAYAVNFIEAVRRIKANLPGMLTSGGVSNLSFAFRGHNALREAMHAVFLYHAIAAGLDMAILNPATAVTYDQIDPALRELLTDVILNRRPGARDELIAYAQTEKGTTNTTTTTATDSWRTESLDNRLATALVKGIDSYLKADIDEALSEGRSAVSIIEGPLMQGMNHVGKLFGEGKMFLPQVVKTARTMKSAVDILRPVMESQRAAGGGTSAGKVVLATVKGDVHDIGKNIVSIVLACNNFEIVDLGVMVPPEEIVAAVKTHDPVFVGLSGLITPSLAEMVAVARLMEREGLSTPVVVGGATTSALHTALKIAPCRSLGPVIHSADAGQNAAIAAALVGKTTRREFVAENQRVQEQLRADALEKTPIELLPLDECRRRARGEDTPAPAPQHPGLTLFDAIPVDGLIPLISWPQFFHAWRVEGPFVTDFPYSLGNENVEVFEAKYSGDAKALDALRLYRDARQLLDRDADRFSVKAAVAMLPARRAGDDIVIDNRMSLPMLRRQSETPLSLADLVTATGDDHIGAFAVTAGMAEESPADEYDSLLAATLCDRLVEAASEWLHDRVRRRLWGFDAQGIRPAVGYPSLPDQSMAHLIATLLPLDRLGMTVTENGALSPASSELGLYFAAPSARYFNLGPIDATQAADYARRRGLPLADLAPFLPLV
ncbi:MAG: methionine synthase [Muribaculaceae bacterium]|nr:methionine synthase [Muribaculaceae bacterium]